MSRTLRQPEIDARPSPQFTEQYLLDRLIAAGIGSLEDWLALSPRARRNIFGITSGMARAIDAIAKSRRNPVPQPARGSAA
jgi:hypothetical protein